MRGAAESELGEWRQERVLKRDLFGAIELGRLSGHDGLVTRRLVSESAWLLRPLARLFAWREVTALRRLEGIAGVPRLVAWRRGIIYRSYLEGTTVAEARPRDPAFYAAARRLLWRVHRRGIAHNDSAKRVNWLVLADGSPGLIDFQLSLAIRRRGALARVARREDLRHLLKHKRFNCGLALTACERRLLARRSLVARLWYDLYQRPYFFVTRRLLNWADREGRGLGAEIDRKERT
jgi:RIO-like serine/threonine protein kinase